MITDTELEMWRRLWKQPVGEVSSPPRKALPSPSRLLGLSARLETFVSALLLAAAWEVYLERSAAIWIGLVIVVMSFAALRAYHRAEVSLAGEDTATYARRIHDLNRTALVPAWIGAVVSFSGVCWFASVVQHAVSTGGAFWRAVCLPCVALSCAVCLMALFAGHAIYGFRMLRSTALVQWANIAIGQQGSGRTAKNQARQILLRFGFRRPSFRRNRARKQKGMV